MKKQNGPQRPRITSATETLAVVTLAAHQSVPLPDGLLHGYAPTYLAEAPEEYPVMDGQIETFELPAWVSPVAVIGIRFVSRTTEIKKCLGQPPFVYKTEVELTGRLFVGARVLGLSQFISRCYAHEQGWACWQSMNLPPEGKIVLLPDGNVDAFDPEVGDRVLYTQRWQRIVMSSGEVRERKLRGHNLPEGAVFVQEFERTPHFADGKHGVRLFLGGTRFTAMESCVQAFGKDRGEEMWACRPHHYTLSDIIVVGPARKLKKGQIDPADFVRVAGYWIVPTERNDVIDGDHVETYERTTPKRTVHRAAAKRRTKIRRARTETTAPSAVAPTATEQVPATPEPAPSDDGLLGTGAGKSGEGG